MNSKDMGFEPEQVLVLNASTVDPQQRITFKNILNGDKGIVDVAMCSTPPGESLFTYGLSFPEHGVDEDQRIVFYQSFVDGEYLDALRLKMVQGRFFSPEIPSDSDAFVVVNKAAVDALSDSALTSTFKFRDAFRNKEVVKSIAGVVSDFNFESLHQGISPLMLEYDPNRCRYFLVRFDVSEAQSVLVNLQQRWQENFASTPFEYYFLKEKFNSLYDNDQRQKKLVALIAGVSICLAALGIFGTTLFMVQQKTKEIGIRKIMGSGRWQLLMLLVKPTILLIAISSAIGVPIALPLGNSWLSQYPYRIDFSVALFVFAFFLILVIVMTTISYQCYKLTRINPTDVLRKITQ
jgi:putative ABC transport system permease protein